MNLGQLIAEFRREADDQITPYLWSDTDITDYANDAQREACRRANLIQDSTSASITQVAVTGGQPLVTLNTKVLRVFRARLASQSAPLAIKGVRLLDTQMPGWESLAAATPKVAIPDWQSGALLLVPSPVAGDTLKLTVFRLPLADMTLTTDIPEIAEEYHRHLVHWMLYRGYMRPDADSFNPAAAQAHEAAFTAQFGPVTAIGEQARRATDRARYEEAK